METRRFVTHVTSLGFRLLVTGIIATLIIVSLYWNLSLIEQHMLERATHEARGISSLILTVREWNSLQGGVYVEVGEKTKPNPHLKVSDRDVNINDKPYTKMNPAFMVRQIGELTNERNEIVVNITSLTPINPANKPNPWEYKALQSFEEGAKEYYQFTSSPRGNFQYAIPLYLEESCLQCHTNEDGLRGAITLTMPTAPLLAMAQPQKRHVISFHALTFFLLAGLNWFFLVQLKQNWQKKQQTEEELLYQAYHDTLTGLANRSSFEKIVCFAIEQEKTNRKKMGILFLDLDNFKEVNDTLGHQVGDELLQKVGLRLTNILRSGDVVARFGGDEFLVLVNPIEELNELTIVAERILEEVKKPYNINSHTLSITSSIGISIYPTDGENYSTLVQKADKALYRSKEKGRNTWTCFGSGVLKGQ